MGAEQPSSNKSRASLNRIKFLCFQKDRNTVKQYLSIESRYILFKVLRVDFHTCKCKEIFSLRLTISKGELVFKMEPVFDLLSLLILHLSLQSLLQNCLHGLHCLNKNNYTTNLALNVNAMVPRFNWY